ncbi:MAG: Phosphoribosylanthranilate isomerase [Fibrobacteres bacterium]|nr:Phosphoribosylanthranilate isomerase [Fibrobacterota bacterium]
MSAVHPVSKPCQVKVCGIRDPADSATLDAMGVEWMGYNFHPGSVRHVSPADAAPMIGALNLANPVGVFVDAAIEFVIKVAASTGIRYIQLHGDEDWEYVMRMPLPVIKAIPHTRLADLGGLRPGLEIASKLPKGSHPLAYFLVDTQAGGAGGFGGSGKAFDWDLLKRHPLPLPFFLAGGLGPHNLSQALAACSPFAVDLNSKVETGPGKKDPEKVKACLELVAAAGRSAMGGSAAGGV